MLYVPVLWLSEISSLSSCLPRHSVFDQGRPNQLLNPAGRNCPWNKKAIKCFKSHIMGDEVFVNVELEHCWDERQLQGQIPAMWYAKETIRWHLPRQVRATFDPDWSVASTLSTMAASRFKLVHLVVPADTQVRSGFGNLTLWLIGHLSCTMFSVLFLQPPAIPTEFYEWESPTAAKTSQKQNSWTLPCSFFTPYSVTERQVAAVNPAVSNNTPAELVGNPVRLLWLQGTTGAVAWAPNNLVLTLFAVCLL